MGKNLKKYFCLFSCSYTVIYLYMNMNLDKNILGIQFLNEKGRRLFLKLYSTKNRQIDKNGEKKDEKHS